MYLYVYENVLSRIKILYYSPPLYMNSYFDAYKLYLLH